MKIFVPVKDNSIRCPGKNRVLLPYTYSYLRRCGRLSDAIVIVNSESLEEYCRQIGFDNIYLETESVCETLSIYNYIKKHDINDDYVIHLQNTQPFRDDKLLDNMINAIDADTDLVLSYITETDRCLYEINEDMDGFIIKDTERKGCMCKERKVCDGAVYLYNTTFLKRICQDTDNINYMLWNDGTIKFVENKSIMFDIDTVLDMTKFENAKNIFKNF